MKLSNRERALLFVFFYEYNTHWKFAWGQISLGQSFVVSKCKTRFVALASDSCMFVTRVKQHTV